MAKDQFGREVNSFGKKMPRFVIPKAKKKTTPKKKK
jgi:hypothetical protein